MSQTVFRSIPGEILSSCAYSFKIDVRTRLGWLQLLKHWFEAVVLSVRRDEHLKMFSEPDAVHVSSYCGCFFSTIQKCWV